jgi:hypothetical protein
MEYNIVDGNHGVKFQSTALREIARMIAAIIGERRAHQKD